MVSYWFYVSIVELLEFLQLVTSGPSITVSIDCLLTKVLVRQTVPLYQTWSILTYALVGKPGPIDWMWSQQGVVAVT